jgi:hypothetical protein
MRGLRQAVAYKEKMAQAVDTAAEPEAEVLPHVAAAQTELQCQVATELVVQKPDLGC